MIPSLLLWSVESKLFKKVTMKEKETSDMSIEKYDCNLCETFLGTKNDHMSKVLTFEYKTKRLAAIHGFSCAICGRPGDCELLGIVSLLVLL
jgi:hypothetical protein